MDDSLIPVALWINTLVAHLQQLGAGSVPGLMGDWLNNFGDTVQQLLIRLPTAVVVASFVALAWWRGRWSLSLFVGPALSLIYAMGFGEQLMVTLSQTVMAVGVTLVFGIPLGIVLGSWRLAARITRPLLDFMQTMPAFVYLIPTAMLFGLGLAPALVATVIYALPPVVRLTAFGIREVESDVVEAATTLGASGWQTLLLVRLPSALPAIAEGTSQTIMMALSMVIIASMVGAGGLGNEVLSAIQRLDIGRGFASGLCVVLLAMMVDRITESFSQRRSLKMNEAGAHQ